MCTNRHVIDDKQLHPLYKLHTSDQTGPVGAPWKESAFTSKFLSQYCSYPALPPKTPTILWMKRMQLPRDTLSCLPRKVRRVSTHHQEVTEQGPACLGEKGSVISEGEFPLASHSDQDLGGASNSRAFRVRLTLRDFPLREDLRDPLLLWVFK